MPSESFALVTKSAIRLQHSSSPKKQHNTRVHVHVGKFKSMRKVQNSKSQTKTTSAEPTTHMVWDHLYSMYVKFSKNLTFSLIRTRVRMSRVKKCINMSNRFNIKGKYSNVFQVIPMNCAAKYLTSGLMGREAWSHTGTSLHIL